MERISSYPQSEISAAQFVGANRHLSPQNSNEYSEKKGAQHVEHYVGAQRHLSSIESINYAETKRAPPRPRKWKRRGLLLWGHYKRWWCFYMMGFIVACAVGFPVLFLVIFPAIAQDLVNSAELPVYSASIMNPTPTSVEYSLVASLKVPVAGLTVRLDPITLDLYNPSTKPDIIPYMQVSLPEYHLRGKTTILKHRTALDNLTGYSIESAELVLPPEADGTNLKGTVIIPNHSIVTFELGNVTLNMIVGDLIIGQATLTNILLYPGNNTMPITGIIDLKTVFDNLVEILQAQSTALKSGKIEITAAGNSVVFNGEHIVYFENVLKNVRLTAEMPILSILTDSLGGFLGSNSTLITGITQALNSTVLTGILGSLSSSLNGTLEGALSSLSGISA